jgi:hypothetical protein
MQTSTFTGSPFQIQGTKKFSKRSMFYTFRLLLCIFLFNNLFNSIAQGQPCPYDISLVSRTYDTAANQTIFVWKVVNPNPGNGNNGTIQDLSHWGFMANTCTNPADALKESDIVSAGTGSSSNSADHSSIPVDIKPDPSQVCTGNNPLLKFNAGGNGSAPKYYSLVLSGNWGPGNLEAYYKSGSRTGCGLCTITGAGVGCRITCPAPAFTAVGPICAGEKALLVATFPAGTSVSNIAWSGTGVSGNVFTAPMDSSETSYPVNFSATVNGCTATGSMTIVVRPIPDPLYLAVYDYCPGEPGGRIEVRSIEAGVSYQVRIVGGATVGPVQTGAAGTNLTFTNIPAGYYQIVATNLTTGCVNAFGGATVAVGSCSITGRITPGVSGLIPASNTLEVVAYPNPFSDQLRFAITSPHSGKATLQLYDLNGSMIKTINIGNINGGGTTIVNYAVPGPNRVSMTYKLTVGGQETTGKLINIK